MDPSALSPRSVDSHNSDDGSGSADLRDLPPTRLDDYAWSFSEIFSVQDKQAIRTADFSPDGTFFAIGSNSALLSVGLTPVKHDQQVGTLGLLVPCLCVSC